jgi:hypothetical protein
MIIQADRPFFNAAKYLFVFVPAIVCFFVVNKYAVNIPSQDDYDAILVFLTRYKTTHGSEKLYLCLSQHNEHRILLSRIVYVLYYSVFEKINFRNMILIGNVQLLFTFIILISFIKKAVPQFWVITSFITGACLFDLTNWENADFAMAAMQNYGVMFLLVLSIWLYSNNGRVFMGLAVIVQVVLMFSSGNGILAAAFIVLFNLINKSRVRQYISAAALFVFAPLYFIHYVSPPTGHASVDIATITTYFFRFISNHTYYDDRLISILNRVFVFACLIFVIITGKRALSKRMLPVICIVGFVITSCLLTAVFRSELGEYIPSRYLIYPHLLTALLFILLFGKLRNKRSLLPVSIPVVFLMLVIYARNFRGGEEGFARLRNTLKTTDYYYPDKSTAKTISDAACKAEIYCIEDNR